MVKKVHGPSDIVAEPRAARRPRPTGWSLQCLPGAFSGASGRHGSLRAVDAPLVVGFDLDLTLVDPRPGVRAAFEALIAETGVTIDIDTVLGRLGPPLEVELAE